MRIPPSAVEGELRLSGNNYQRCCPLGTTIGGSATIRCGMVSDYRATIQRLSQSESHTEVFPNFPKTFQKPDQNFFKTVRKIERFFCAAGEGLSRACGLGAGAARQAWRRQVAPGRRDLPLAAIMRTSAGTGSGPGASRTAQGLGGAAQVIRGHRSGTRRAAGLAVRRAAAAADAAVSLPLWSGGLCRGHCAVSRCNAAVGRVRGRCGVFMALDRYLTLSHKKRSEGVLEALRAIDTYARISGGQCRTRQDAHRRRRTRKSPAGHNPDGAKRKPPTWGGRGATSRGRSRPGSARAAVGRRR